MCRILAKTKNMSREEWLELRKRGIGGSDAGAVCGLNPYTTAMDVFVDKMQENTEEKPDNEAMKQGRDLEEYVARRFTETTGIKVRRSHAMYVNENYPFMIADVDRLIVGQNAGLESKTASPYTSDKWKDGQVPAHYLAQCYHYMAVLGAEAWYIAVVIYGREFKFVKLERDEEIIQHLIQIEEQFWNHHVLAGIMPEPDGSDAAEKFINSYFKDSREDSSVPLLGFDEKLKRRCEIVALMDRLTMEKKQIEQEIKAYMQDAELAENDNFFVSWKQTASQRLDSARLKAEMPEIYQQFCKQSQSRRFIVKSLGEVS
ncbi:MAG: YqaJ viral recombinase family protein [Lachnospiraceae bacterium]|nr:YqaJ viral recombinase family protein [Lachnospiraceae bacterium]